MRPVESADLNLVGESRSVGLARRFVSDALCTWGISGLVDSARLVVSELVTNAVLHAGTDVLLRVVFDGVKVRLEVTDDSPDPPRRRHYGSDATTGRGLALVAAASESWGTNVGEAGKTVWAELISAPGARPTQRSGSSAVPGSGAARSRGFGGAAGAGAGVTGELYSRPFVPPEGLSGPWRVA